MNIPTPVDQLPSFKAGGNVSNQPGSNKWIPYIIVGGILLVAISVSIAVNRKVQRDRMNFNKKENEDGNKEV